MQDDFTLQDYNVRNGDVVIQIKDIELLASADSQLSQWAQQQQSKLDNIQLVFPSGLRICRVCRVPAYFQRGWCCNINCRCKGNASTALPQQWLCQSGYVRNNNRLSNRILIRLNWFFLLLGSVSVQRVVSGLT